MSTLHYLDDVMEVLHYSPKRESFKEIQKVLHLPEVNIVKQSDTCVKAVKASYSSVVLAPHEPEALGLSKALSSHSTTAAMYLLDYILPQSGKA